MTQESVKQNSHEERTGEEFQQLQRDFINAVFGLLKGLALHDINNASLQRPLKNFEEAWQRLRALSDAKKGVEIKYEDNLLTVMGKKLNRHFSTVEAMKVVPEHMEVALLESIHLQPSVTMEQIGEFFSKWALHASVHQKPKALEVNVAGIDIIHVDPDKANLRLKTKNLLMSPRYALQHYYRLKALTEEFFQGVAGNKVISQKGIRRELLEMLEIAKVNPYQLVALSLLRPGVEEKSELAPSVYQALATSMLSLVLARELEFSTREQVNIGMIGLMYNIGLLSQELSKTLNTDKELSPVEYKRILDAQASGVFKLLQSQGSSRPTLERLLAIFEMAQASKKPISLTLESRILRLASTYVALTSHRPFRDAYLPYEAMKLIGSKATKSDEASLDPVLYYVFVRFMGIYPVGSLVQLSSQEKAVVFRPFGEKMGVPMVKMLAADEESSGVLVDLSQEDELSIAKALDPKREGVQVTGYFFE